MRRDLIIGILISALIHGGVFYGDKIFKSAPKPKKVAEAAPKIELIEMPKLEPDEPDIVEASDEPVKPLDFAPPMQADIPQMAPPDAFVQQIQPPPPENVRMAANIMSIPTDRDMSKFRGGDLFDISKLDEKPIPRFQAKPQYPFEMRRAGTGGDVLVDFIVDANGDVQNAFAAKSSAREFESAAVQAVMKWKFKPGQKGGRKVNTHMQVPIVFSLNDE
jgi:protein TonB